MFVISAIGWIIDAVITIDMELHLFFPLLIVPFRVGFSDESFSCRCVSVWSGAHLALFYFYLTTVPFLIADSHGWEFSLDVVLNFVATVDLLTQDTGYGCYAHTLAIFGCAMSMFLFVFPRRGSPRPE